MFLLPLSIISSPSSIENKIKVSMLINPDKKRTGTLRTSQYDGLLYISFLSLFLIVLTKAIKRFWFDSNYECPLWDSPGIDRGFLALDFYWRDISES